MSGSSCCPAAAPLTQSTLMLTCTSSCTCNRPPWHHACHSQCRLMWCCGGAPLELSQVHAPLQMAFWIAAAKSWGFPCAQDHIIMVPQQAADCSYYLQLLVGRAAHVLLAGCGRRQLWRVRDHPGVCQQVQHAGPLGSRLQVSTHSCLLCRKAQPTYLQIPAQHWCMQGPQRALVRAAAMKF